jgi:hypothetical protein
MDTGKDTLYGGDDYLFIMDEAGAIEQGRV